MSGIHEYADVDQLVIYVVGNKADLIDKREVSMEEAQSLAKELGIKYYETSAKSGDNVEIIFEELAKDMIKKQEKSNITIESEQSIPKSSKKPIENAPGEQLNTLNMADMLKKPKKNKFKLPC